MIKSIIEFLDGTLSTFPVKLLGLAELRFKSAQETDTVFPVVYKGKGKFQAVNEIKNLNGWIYHRTFDFSEENLTEDVPNQPKIARTFPFITVALIPKGALKDDVYSSSDLAQALSNHISLNVFDAPNLISDIFVNDTLYDPIQVAALEFQGIDYFVPADMVLIRVNWSARFEGRVSCFPTVELC